MKIKKVLIFLICILILSTVFSGCSSEKSAEKVIEITRQACFADEIDEKVKYRNYTIGEVGDIWNGIDGCRTRWDVGEDIPYYDELKSFLGNEFDEKKYYYSCMHFDARDSKGEYTVGSSLFFSVDKETENVEVLGERSDNNLDNELRIEKTDNMLTVRYMTIKDVKEHFG